MAFQEEVTAVVAFLSLHHLLRGGNVLLIYHSSALTIWSRSDVPHLASPRTPLSSYGPYPAAPRSGFTWFTFFSFFVLFLYHYLLSFWLITPSSRSSSLFHCLFVQDLLLFFFFLLNTHSHNFRWRWCFPNHNASVLFWVLSLSSLLLSHSFSVFLSHTHTLKHSFTLGSFFSQWLWIKQTRWVNSRAQRLTTDTPPGTFPKAVVCLTLSQSALCFCMTDSGGV